MVNPGMVQSVTVADGIPNRHDDSDQEYYEIHPRHHRIDIEEKVCFPAIQFLLGLSSLSLDLTQLFLTPPYFS